MTGVSEILAKTGAILDNDHFVYSSGKHGSTYINKNDLFAYPEAMEQLGSMLAERLAEVSIETVAVPAMCGILPGNRVAYGLSKHHGRQIFSVFAERDQDKNFTFKRGYEKFVYGKSVLVVDDIMTSGSTLKKFLHLVKETGGTVLSIGVIVNRNASVISSDYFGVPIVSLLDMDIPAYEAKDCQLCREGVPVNTTYGHGKDFVHSKVGRLT